MPHNAPLCAIQSRLLFERADAAAWLKRFQVCWQLYACMQNLSSSAFIWKLALFSARPSGRQPSHLSARRPPVSWARGPRGAQRLRCLCAPSDEALALAYIERRMHYTPCGLALPALSHVVDRTLLLLCPARRHSYC